MPQADSQEHSNNVLEILFLQVIQPIIPKVVGQACAGLGHYPSQTELDDYVQEISELLLENDRHVLHSFHHRSKPQTWLYTIARRHILHQLQKHSRQESLDDMPPDSSIFVIQPDQEKRLLAKEMVVILHAALNKLTKRERKLLTLLLQERSIEEIAKEMRIKKRSVSREVIAVTDRLQKVVRKGNGN